MISIEEANRSGNLSGPHFISDGDDIIGYVRLDGIGRACVSLNTVCFTLERLVELTNAVSEWHRSKL